MRYLASRSASCRRIWCRVYLSTPCPNAKPIATEFYGRTVVVKRKIPTPSGRCWAIWIYIYLVKEITAKWVAFLERNWPLTKVLRAFVLQYGRPTHGGSLWWVILIPGMAAVM